MLSGGAAERNACAITTKRLSGEMTQKRGGIWKEERGERGLRREEEEEKKEERGGERSGGGIMSQQSSSPDYL